MSEVGIRIERIAAGPALVIEDAVGLASDFFSLDASSAPGGYDDQAGTGDPERVTREDVVAINRTMRARSPHAAWDALILAAEPLPWLAAIDAGWDLVELDDVTWQEVARPAVRNALAAGVAKGRGLSVTTKVLHLKRPAMFPVLDSLVLENLGVTEKVPPIQVVDHLRRQGRLNREALRAVQSALRPRYDRSLVRIIDALLWVSHPAAGLGPALGRWEHVVRAAATVGAAPDAPVATAHPDGRRSPAAGTSLVRAAGTGAARPTFRDVFERLQAIGPATVTSSRGTRYLVTAQVSNGVKVIVGRPRSGQVRIHEDCWGQDLTCQRTRAGGIYHGAPSIFDWYADVVAG